MALALASHDANSTDNSTTAFLISRQLKLGITQLFWSCDLIGHQLWHHVMLMASPIAPLHPLGQDNLTDVQHDFFGYVTPLVPVSM